MHSIKFAGRKQEGATLDMGETDVVQSLGRYGYSSEVGIIMNV